MEYGSRVLSRVRGLNLTQDRSPQYGTLAAAGANGQMAMQWPAVMVGHLGAEVEAHRFQKLSAGEAVSSRNLSLANFCCRKIWDLRPIGV
jgi:hypothetical protein